MIQASGLVSSMSVYCDSVRWQLRSVISISEISPSNCLSRSVPEVYSAAGTPSKQETNRPAAWKLTRPLITLLSYGRACGRSISWPPDACFTDTSNARKLEI